MTHSTTLGALVVATLCCFSHAQRKVGVANPLPSKIREPSRTLINRRTGELSGQYNGLPFAKNPALRRDGTADLQVDKRRRLGTLETSGGQKAGVRNVLDANGRPTNNTNYVFDGRRGRKVGTASLTGDGARANTGRHNPGLDWREAGNGGADVHLDADGRQQATVAKRGNEFDFTGDQSGRTQHLTSDSQTRSQGTGTIRTHDGRDYKYETDGRRNGQGTASLKDPRPGLGRSQFDWECVGADGRPTQCSSANGRRTGSVVTDDQGGARVSTNRGTQLARVQTEKVGTEYRTNIVQPIGRGPNARESKPLYLGKASDFKTYDCYRDMAGRNDPNEKDVQVHKPIKFTYNAQVQPDGSTAYAFPDCFAVEADMTLGPNVDVKSIAVEFRVRINPLGDVNCADPGTCSRGSCYYCNLCDEENAKMRILRNYDTEEVCAADGGRRFRVKATFCPPPDTKDWPVCTKFSRSTLSGYWADRKAIMARIIVWQRPADEEKISDETLHKLQSGTLTQVLQAEYILDKAKNQQSSGVRVSDEELRQFAVRKKERLLDCTQGEIDYDLAGSKVGGKFLVSMSDALKKKGFGTENIFGEEQCPEVQELENREHERVVNDWESRGRPNGGLLGALGGALGGGGSSSSSGSGIFGGGSSGGSGGSSPFGQLGSLFNRG